MPIYAYKCESCGFAKDVLQKMSDPQLTDCPSCGTSAFKKQLTSAGFQLKGSGWYATDFKGGTSAPSTATTASPGADTASKSAESGTKPSETSSPKTDSAPPSASGGCGGSCACH